MKLIEAMKLIKELSIKADDLRGKVKVHCADLNFETPTYDNQREQISQWIQAHTDIVQNILRLRVAIQRTNLATKVEMELGGKRVVKTIAEWIHRRRDLAAFDQQMWMGLTDKNLKEGQHLPNTSNPTQLGTPVTIRRYYDPKERDEKIMLFKTEPGVIDRTLEVVNAVTDIIPNPSTEPTALAAAA